MKLFWIMLLGVMSISFTIKQENILSMHRIEKVRDYQDSILSFPKFKEHSSYGGDLNQDGVKDKIVIFEKKCDENFQDGHEEVYCRRIAVYLGSLRGNYTLYGYNDDLVDCSACGGAGVGDAFQGIIIKGKYFSIEQYYGACDKTFAVTTFKFDTKSSKIYLHKMGTEDSSCRQEENVDDKIKIVTKIKTVKDFGKIEFTKYH